MKLVYGIVHNREFISENMNVKVNVDDGIYSIDVMSDNYLKSITPADLIEFDKYVKKSKKMNYVFGLSFENKFIPFDVMKWKQYGVLIPVTNIVSDEWEIVKILHVSHKKLFYFIESVTNNLTDILFQVHCNFDENKNLDNLKNITPEMRLLFSFHLFEKQRKEIEAQKLKDAELLKTIGGRLKSIVETAGGHFIDYKTKNRGYEINWSLLGERINTFIDKNFHVIEAGFCVSGKDKILTMRSAVNVLHDYINDGDHVHKTRTIN